MVTEGNFAEVITYKDQKKYLLDVFSFEKKALVVVNAQVTVSFDLSKITYDIDAENKTLTLKYIPQEEIKIYPDYKYYDMQQSKLNEFTAEDYNKINKNVRANLAKKIEKSTLKTNAQNIEVADLFRLFVYSPSQQDTSQVGQTVQNIMEPSLGAMHMTLADFIARNQSFHQPDPMPDHAENH